MSRSTHWQWLRRCAASRSSSKASRPGRSFLTRTPRIEPLEDRRLLAVFTVTNLDDAGPGTLRDAIGLANNSAGADQIVFAGAAAYGAIALTNGALEVTDTLTITSVDASGNVRTIDAQQRSRVFHFSSATGDLTLEGLRVTGGLSESAGGGILFVSSGTLTLNNSKVDHNSTTGRDARGGGIATGAGSVSIFGSSVIFNSTAGEYAHGGGIATDSGSVSISSSDISSNNTTADRAHGGGIFSRADVSLTESVVNGNGTAGRFARGGGVYSSGDVSVISSRVSYNHTLEENAPGGGVHSRGDVLINGSTVRNNYTRGFGSYGGGVFSMGDMTLTNSTVTENRTHGGSAFGGGLRVQVGYGSVLGGALSINNSTVSDNYTRGNYAVGGGVSAGTVSISSSTISNNRTHGVRAPGGGISAGSAAGPGRLTLTSSTVSGNQVWGNYSNAAGISAYGPTSILSSTITGNEGTNSLNAVGGILVRSNFGQVSFTVQNSIVTGNTDNGVAPDLAAGQRVVLSVNHSLIGDTTGSTITEATGAGNLLNQPALLGPLADNGGPTQTHALLSASLAIDAGDPNFIVTTDQYDQRGASFARVNRGRIDMGAYETVELRVNDNAADIDDGDPDNGVMTLREAINLANASPAVDTITFDAGVFGQGILLGGTELEITDTLTIAGPGPELLRIDAQQGSRVINFSSASGDLTLEGLTVTGGQTAEHGGGILFSSNGALTLTSSTVSANSTTGDYGFGGGIRTGTGSVSLTNSTVSGNSTTGPTASGGGISTVSGGVSLTSSTLSGNRTTGYTAPGGGISTTSGGISLVSSTISGNTSEGRFGRGGGIYTSFGSVSLSRSTISDNAASGLFATGGGIGSGDGSTGNPVFTIENSIVAGNTASGLGPDLKPKSGSAFTINHSLIGDPSGGVSAGQLRFAITNGVGNQQNVDPLLGPLADNGGKTQTHALLPGSPAIDAGGTADLPQTDQRGFPFLRSYDDPIAAGAGPDIGAYELQPFVEVLSLVVSSTSDVFDNNFSPGQVSLREAIVLANANPGPDTITFSSLFDTPQAILLEGSELEITDTLTITGPGQDLLTIDAQQTSRVLHFSALTGDLTLAGLTLTGGRTTDDNPPSYTNFASETIHSGGGIRFLSSGLLSLTNSTISSSSTVGSHATGGAIFSATGDVTLTGSTVSGNSTSGGGAHGGGIGALSGNVTLISSTVSGNSTTGSGADGGGVVTYSGDVTLISSTVSGNTGNGKGGGVRTRSGDVTLNSSTVSGNSTAGEFGKGGGLYNSQGAIRLSGSTIIGNSTAGIFADGGGVGFATSYTTAPVTIENSIVTGNTNRGAPDDIFDLVRDRSLTIHHSLIGDASSAPGSLFFIQQAIDGGVGNLQNIDPLLGPLADNGGPTPTHALLPGSPALNAGDPAIALSAVEFDQRGPGFARVSYGRLDMGAFELDNVAIPSGGLVVDTLSDVVDFDLSPGQFSLREAIFLANANAGPNTITFATGMSGQTVLLTGGELEITETLTIDASALTSNVVIDAQQQSRVLNFSTTSGDLSLERLTLTGGNVVSIGYGSTGGGGILFNSDGALTLTSSTISGNSTTGFGASGGGISAHAGNVSLVNSAVSNNTTTGQQAYGGGIHTHRGDISLTNSTVSGNSTAGYYAYGGGLRTRYGDVTLTGSTISGNSTTGNGADGGGIYASSGTTLITNSTVSGNFTTGDRSDGGGIRAGSLTVTGSTISGNSTAGSYASGGGIRSDGLTLTNSTVSGNSTAGSDSHGGGIVVYHGEATLTSSTVTGNSTAGMGG
ncbi:right-handed parallel beta-helix repeat-containing protein, partial [Botrimarina colliarenosi]|uniref:right-handed parallel beta-helix repeat-containing protein n=1 Tax=Botrimarina colliarenosi TaxID=2528001 RepID=UPI0011B793E3